VTHDQARTSTLAHPLWLLSLALLVLNDHLFKHEPLLAGTLTGKLSDFAGLVVAPPLLAVLVRARSARARALCLVLVAAGFAAVKVSSSSARALEGVLGLLGIPSRIWVDPTDLIALPSLLLAQRIMEQAEPMARWASRSALVAGLFACMATSSARDFGHGTLALINRRNAPLDATVRFAPVDCETFTPEVAAQLRELHFGSASDVELAAQDWLFLGDSNESCGVAWLTVGDAFDGVIAWQDLEHDHYEGDPIDRELLESAVTVEGTADTLKVSIGEQLVSFPAPTHDE
jgi:hypothetical protein